MSITVNQIVIHQLIKTQQDDAVQFERQLREQLLTLSPEVDQMMLQLHQVYQSKAKGYGVFQEQSAFAHSLNRWLEQEDDFLAFSHQASQLLANELSKYEFTDSGTLILCHYNFLATDYLFIALLDNKSSMLVDDHLDIQRTHYLDTVQFDMACRINLTELQINAASNRYLTFVKGRVGRKVGDFFMDFLAASEGLNPQVQNQTLLQAVNDYCEQGELNHTQTREVKKQVFEYCKGQINAGDEIALDALSDVMPTLNEQPFSNFAADQNYGLEASIPPVRNTLKSLTKFSGSGKGVTLSFDAQLLDERIIWDELNDTLTIKGLPSNLRDQLQKNRQS